MSESHRAPKQYWHPMSLQSLPPETFARVVTRILQQQLTLVPLMPKDAPEAAVDSSRGEQE